MVSIKDNLYITNWNNTDGMNYNNTEPYYFSTILTIDKDMIWKLQYKPKVLVRIIDWVIIQLEKIKDKINK